MCSKCGASGHSATECKQTGCSECGSTTHQRAMSFACPEHKCSNCEGTLEPKGHNRNDCPRMETTNAVKPATAQTIAPFVHAILVAFEVTNYQPAIYKLAAIALRPPHRLRSRRGRSQLHPRSLATRLQMANKLIETAFKRGALSMPTTIEVEQVEKVGKTLHATYLHVHQGRHRIRVIRHDR